MNFELFKKFTTQGYITENDLDRAIDLIRRSRPTIGEIAKEKKYLNSKQILTILSIQNLTTKPFGEIALEEGFLTKEQLIEIIEEQEKREMNIIEALTKINIQQENIEKIKQFIKNEVKL